jgi:hypothetical protein
MAVKFPSWLWVRNNDLTHYVEGGGISDPCLSDKVKAKLKNIMDEMDLLYAESRDNKLNSNPIIEENVLLVRGVVEITEKSYNPEKSAKYLEQIHGILRDYRVNYDTYRRFGEIYKELGVEIKNPELKYSIELATEEASWSGRGGHFELRFCPKMMFEQNQMKGKERM